MTDENRTWSRPVEELVDAIDTAGRKWIADYQAAPHTGAGSDPLYVGWGDVPDEVFAQAALTRLISLGFINENGIEAMKAEKEAK